MERSKSIEKKDGIATFIHWKDPNILKFHKPNFKTILPFQSLCPGYVATFRYFVLSFCYFLWVFSYVIISRISQRTPGFNEYSIIRMLNFFDFRGLKATILLGQDFSNYNLRLFRIFESSYFMTSECSYSRIWD